ncbi:CAZyme family GH114 [Penicillium paradoxum]|uniref:CAZyme family GH114 n=1 Tax=Penicillium paradoxum TaxID=176176 RepID=UPI002547A66B|nr:CAZyme family GH114 [Penicillium paradoxum]KAJ5773061.1 CAZyme family GH114 [Penicillium paradoxum]
MNSPNVARWQVLATPKKLLVSCVLGLFFFAIGMDLRAELGAGHNQKKMLKRDTTSSGDAAIWQPAAGVKWQIQLIDAVEDTSVDADIWDIDLFDNTAETISTLQSKGHKVICYFSAGTYEDWRPDVSKFDPADFGSNLDEWPGERWLNIKSASIRSIMASRLDMAKQKGCDGVDPDNIDAYGNENGLGLTEADSIDFLTFLAAESHSRGMSIGLKNGGDIIGSVIDKMQWSVNEQCAQYDECDVYAAFTEVNKPVFHIEYSGQTIESDSSPKSSDTIDTEISITTNTTTDTDSDDTITGTPAPASTSSSTAPAPETNSTDNTTDADDTDDVDYEEDEDEDEEEEQEEDEDEDEEEEQEEDEDEDEEEYHHDIMNDKEDKRAKDIKDDVRPSGNHEHRQGHGHHKLRARAVLSSALKTSACNAASADKFSTVIKNMNLDAWVEYC